MTLTLSPLARDRSVAEENASHSLSGDHERTSTGDETLMARIPVPSGAMMITSPGTMDSRAMWFAVGRPKHDGPPIGPRGHRKTPAHQRFAQLEHPSASCRAAPHGCCRSDVSPANRMDFPSGDQRFSNMRKEKPDLTRYWCPPIASTTQTPPRRRRGSGGCLVTRPDPGRLDHR